MPSPEIMPAEQFLEARRTTVQHLMNTDSAALCAVDTSIQALGFEPILPSLILVKFYEGGEFFCCFYQTKDVSNEPFQCNKP